MFGSHAQGRPFSSVGQDVLDVESGGVDVEKYERMLKASQEANRQLQVVLPTIPLKIATWTAVWFGLIYWFLIRRK